MRLALDGNQAGFKAKNRREVSAPRRIGARYLHKWLVPIKSAGWQSICLLRRLWLMRRFNLTRTARCWMHQMVEHQNYGVPGQEVLGVEEQWPL